MKHKLLFITLFACGLGWGQVIISQVYEGASNNKWIEITNVGNSSIDLTNPVQYKIGIWSIGSDTGNGSISGTPSSSILLTGSLSAGAKFLIRNTSSSTTVPHNPMPSGNNSNTTVAGFNGNDAIAIFTGTNTIVDAFGHGINNKDISYHRNSDVLSANASFTISEWTSKSLTEVANATSSVSEFIGTHIFNSPITYTTLWSNGTGPTASLNAIIDGDLTTTTDLVCKDLTINSGKTLTIGAGNKLTVSGNLINNGTIIFKSDVNGTAMFDTFSGTLSGSGVTTVERFIPARRAYRFLSPAVTTSTTIRQNWQENGGTAAGLGTHITGTGGATNGFDPTETNNSSLLLFTNGAWVGATSTNVSLTAGNAYCLMVRGDRTTDLTSNTPTASNTVLRATGTLFTGNFTPALSAAASGYSFIGNPYQAPLDIKTALQSSTDVNKNVVYYWDPTINARGGYITRNLQTSQNNITSSVNDYVQPGQAFFVVNEPTLTSTPALTFTENHKSVANAAAGVFRNANTNEYGTLRVNLQANTNNQWQTIEGALAIFNDTFSWNVTSEDATKMTNLDEEVSFVQNNTNLAIALQSNPSATSELPIKIDKMRHTNYKWQFELDNYNGATPFLFDTLNNSYTQINNGTAVPFTADANNTTNRFKIVFQNAVLSNATFQNTLAIYPNPAKAGASFYIEGVSEATVTVSNLLGQTVPVQTKSQGTTLQVIPNNSLSQGVYLVNITSEGNTQQVKWIVE